MISNECPYCDYMFYSEACIEVDLQFKKYRHLTEHNEFKEKINTILGKYPNIKKYVKIKYDSKFNKNRNTHQFLQVIYNNKDRQYFYLLNKFEEFLKNYGEYLENIEQNMVSKKTLSDFFAFYSELEVMENLEETFNERPQIFKSDNNQNTDFILNSNQLIVEVKTPLESNKKLFDYIQERKQQKQLKEVSKKYPNYYKILIINLKYRYPDFGNIQGFRSFFNDKNIFWDCCIAYNNFNNNGDYLILNTKEKQEKIALLLNNLKGEKQKSLISLGMEQSKN